MAQSEHLYYPSKIRIAAFWIQFFFSLAWAGLFLWIIYSYSVTSDSKIWVMFAAGIGAFVFIIHIFFRGWSPLKKPFVVVTPEGIRVGRTSFPWGAIERIYFGKIRKMVLDSPIPPLNTFGVWSWFGPVLIVKPQDSWWNDAAQQTNKISIYKTLARSVYPVVGSFQLDTPLNEVYATVQAAFAEYKQTHSKEKSDEERAG